MKLDLDLACYRCKRMAYTDRFEGELDDLGYICNHCVRVLNEEALDKAERKWRDPKAEE